MNAEIYSFEDFLHLPPSFFSIWSHLAATTGQIDPVCCGSAWQLAWHAAQNPEFPIVAASDSGCLACFAAHVTTDKVLLTPPEWSWCFGQPLLGWGATLLLEEIIKKIRHHYKPRILQILLSGLCRHSMQANKIISRFARKYRLYEHDKFVEGAASLSGGVDGWLARRSSNTRAKLKKALRLAKNEGIYFERFSPATQEQAQNLFGVIEAIENRSWKGKNNCGINQPATRQFYFDFMAGQTAAKSVRVILAMQDGKPLGYIFGSVLGKFYRGQQFSYDEQFARFSIGNIMQHEEIIWLCEEGIQRYDMGPITGPRMDYKLHWTEQALPSESWLMIMS